MTIQPIDAECRMHFVEVDGLSGRVEAVLIGHASRLERRLKVASVHLH